jgi:hypothetical protein
MVQVALDTYDLAKNPVLAAYARAHPGRVPPADAGLPFSELVLSAMIERLWCRLVCRDPTGRPNDAELDKFFGEADRDGDGSIDLAELSLAFEARVGGAASRIVVERMMSNCDANR